MKIITERKRIEVINYSRSFTWTNDPSAGFGFPSDENGNVDVTQLSATGRENYKKCTNGTFDVRDQGVITMRHHYTEPATGKCDDCGRTVELFDPLTNECECGALYNMSGQRLAPRSQWEER